MGFGAVFLPSIAEETKGERIGVGAETAAFAAARVNMDPVTTAVLHIGFGHWGTDGLNIRSSAPVLPDPQKLCHRAPVFFSLFWNSRPLGLLSKLDLTVSGVFGFSSYLDHGPGSSIRKHCRDLILDEGSELGMGLGLGASIDAGFAF